MIGENKRFKPSTLGAGKVQPLCCIHGDYECKYCTVLFAVDRRVPLARPSRRRRRPRSSFPEDYLRRKSTVFLWFSAFAPKTYKLNRADLRCRRRHRRRQQAEFRVSRGFLLLGPRRHLWPRFSPFAYCNRMANNIVASPCRNMENTNRNVSRWFLHPCQSHAVPLRMTSRAARSAVNRVQRWLHGARGT